VPIDDIRRYRFDRFRSPARLAVLIDDCCANAFDEVVPGNASERDTVVLGKTLLKPGERRR